jgi:acetoin utilization deacetylase AcuC-like enzyme
VQAVADVLEGRNRNAYALSRPPGHHCLPDYPMGFCLLANIAIAIEAARAARPGLRVAVVDWDVHHGNGTEAIFIDRPDVLTISLHQDRNFPHDTGGADIRGEGAGAGCNINIPLPPGSGHRTYLLAMETIVMPALRRFSPDIIVVACGYDASGVDPLSRMLASSATFAGMTGMVMESASELCGGRLALAHEGGYSEAHVPFCGHAVLQRLSGSPIEAPDPLQPRIDRQQPDARLQRFQEEWVRDLAGFFAGA